MLVDFGQCFNSGQMLSVVAIAQPHCRELLNMQLPLPYTGTEFLDSLDDGREVWIYGERARNVGEHPAFRNTARMLARLYDALHRDHADERHLVTCLTEWGGFTRRYFVAPRSAEELVAARDATAARARLSYGWLGRSPDHKAAFLATLGANTEFCPPYEDNARRLYRYSQQRVPFVSHAIVQPPVEHGPMGCRRPDRYLHARNQGNRCRDPRHWG
jgi:4-hydroxyphenylacetate 3-monooxygenase